MRPRSVRHVLAAVAAVSPGRTGAIFVFAPAEAVREAAGVILSAPEQARIERFHPPEERARRSAAHTLKRLMLARLLGQEAAAIPCAGGGSGPPVVPGRSDIALTLAHGGRWVAVGLGTCGPVGIDVERERPDFSWPLIGETLSRSGVAERDPEPAGLQRWCRLEARVKRAGGWPNLREEGDDSVASLALDHDHAGAAAWSSASGAEIVIVR